MLGVILKQVADNKNCDYDTNARIQNIPQILRRFIKKTGEQFFDVIYKTLEQKCR